MYTTDTLHRLLTAATVELPFSKVTCSFVVDFGRQPTQDCASVASSTLAQSTDITTAIALKATAHQITDVNIIINSLVDAA